MLKLKTSLAVNISQSLVMDKLMTFPERYRHHFSNSYKGIWQCELVDIKKDAIIFQFIDKSFDFSKGKKTEAPLIVLKTLQNEKGTTIQISLQWIKSKIILLALSLVFLVACCVLLLCASAFGMAILFFSVLGLCIYWIIFTRKHDILAFDVFTKLLTKNFGEDFIC